jgi:hypothetical protein
VSECGVIGEICGNRAGRVTPWKIDTSANCAALERRADGRHVLTCSGDRLSPDNSPESDQPPAGTDPTGGCIQATISRATSSRSRASSARSTASSSVSPTQSFGRSLRLPRDCRDEVSVFLATCWMESLRSFATRRTTDLTVPALADYEPGVSAHRVRSGHPSRFRHQPL